MYSLLTQLGLKYKTDKSYPHFFTEFYSKHFENNRNNIKNILEIGIDNGRSLKMWKEYFENAIIYGIDIHPACLINEDRIVSKLISQTNFDLFDKEFKSIEFDIIIDDASHINSHQINGFKNSFKYVKSGGFYVLEDLHTSFMEGHWKDTNISTYEFLKNLNYNEYQIQFIEFYNKFDYNANIDCITSVIKKL